MNKTKNRFAGVKIWDSDSESQPKPVINEETLTIHVCNFVVAQLGKAEQVNKFNTTRTTRGGFKSRADERKEFADILVSNHGRKGVIVINKDDTTTKKMQKIANDRGYSLFYNVKSFAEFKQWFNTNMP